LNIEVVRKYLNKKSAWLRWSKCRASAALTWQVRCYKACGGAPERAFRISGKNLPVSGNERQRRIPSAGQNPYNARLAPLFALKNHSHKDY